MVKSLQKVERADPIFLRMEEGQWLSYRKPRDRVLPPGNYRTDSGGDDACRYFAHPIACDEYELDADQKEVFDQVLQFFSQRDKYLKLNFRHKRGILLHGLPGTGKTTLVKAIINEFIAKGAVSLECGVGDLESSIANCRLDSDTPIIWVYEDIDGMGRSEEQRLTEIMDGMNGLNNDNILFLATTNFLHRVSPRLKNRPGRFDRKIEVGYPSASAREAYIRSLVKDESTEKEIKMLTKISAGMTVAHIKELVVNRVIYKVNDEELAKTAAELLATCKENSELLKNGKSDDDDESNVFAKTLKMVTSTGRSRSK